MTLNNLNLHLSARHEQLGAIGDLDEAIVLGREALTLPPQDYLERSMCLNNLAVDLSSRYDKIGAIENLEEAIPLDREALACASVDIQIGHRLSTTSQATSSLDTSSSVQCTTSKR